MSAEAKTVFAARSSFHQAYLLQFSAPVKTGTWLSELRKKGVQPVVYVPADGYLVWCSGGQLLQALSLRTSTGFPMIHSVSPVTWQDRLEPALNALADGKTPPGSDPGWAAGSPIPVHIWAFQKDLTGRLAGTVSLSDSEAKLVEDAHDTYITASLTLADIEALVRNEPAVRYVEIVRQKMLNNDLVPLSQICDVETEWTSGWNGAGVIVDHNDSGVDLTHPDFPSGVILATVGAMSNTDNGHGTHTAGSVLGRGLAGSSPADTSGCGDQLTPETTVRGMAYGANLVTNNIFSGGVTGDAAMMQWGSQHGAALSTNSWSATLNGNPVLNYDSNAIAMDNAVRDADSGTSGNQALAIFFSAGNSGSGSSTVGSPGLAKDVVTVGASQNARCGSYVPIYQAGPDINTVATFSSRGPSQGRIKPDVCTPGTDVLSTESQDSQATYGWDQSWTGTYYALDSGTSMSCPLTAGMGADFYQFYDTTFGAAPSPALIKAALINGAVDMGLGYPSNDQGWGRTNLKNSIEGPSGGTVAFLDQSDTTPVGTGDVYEKLFSVSNSGVPLKITLVWTDPPGAANCTSCLINNLDLEVLAPDGTAYHGNQFTSNWSTSNASGWDVANNVENVFVQTPSTGLWTIHVKGTSVPTVPSGVTGGQDFALVWSGVVGPPCTTPGAPSGLGATANGDNRIDLSWSTGSPAGSTYNVYRAQGTCPQGSYSLLAGGISGTSYSDTSASGTLTYAYVVTAVDSTGGCESDQSNCAQATATGACIAPPGFSGLSSVTDSGNATCELDLSWNAATPSCGSSVYYNVYRSTSSSFSPSAANRIVTGVVGTSYNDTNGLVSGSMYYYIVRAVDPSNGAEDANLTIHGGAATGPGMISQTIYSRDFETGSGTDGWGLGYFVSGGSVADWRGIQSCTAHSGSHIYRFGGTTCAGNYGSSDFCFAAPNGGIAIPSDATQVRLSFWHRWNFQSGSDGGTLVVSLDGQNYHLVPAGDIVSGSSYNGTLGSTCEPSGASGIPVFTGAQSSFVNTIVDLDAIVNAITGGSGGAAGQTVWIGFTGISNCVTQDDGWFLDDVSVTAQVPATCSTGGSAGGVKPVPDGKWVSGTAAKATRANADGSSIDLTWDVSTCQNPDYNVYYGSGSGLSTYTLTGSACAVGNSGSAAWSAPAIPGGEKFIWWVIVGSDGVSTESTWGNNSSGTQRHPAASGQCGMTAKSTATTCP